MSDFLSKLKESVDSGEVNKEAVSKINEINELVEERYGKAVVGEKLSIDDLSKLEEKVENIAGEKKVSDIDMLGYLETLKEAVVINAEIKLETNMLKSMAYIINQYDFIVNGLLFDALSVKDKELEEAVFNDAVTEEVVEILNKILLFELEYCDYLDKDDVYLKEIVPLKNNILKILGK